MQPPGSTDVAQPAAFREFASRRWPSIGQAVLVAILISGLIAALVADAALTAVLLILFVQLAFLVTAAWRVVLLFASGRSTEIPAPLFDKDLPHYTILVALLDEADIVDQLVGRLAAIDYPARRLTGFLILEHDDLETISACQSAARPSWLKVLIAPPGGPRTKPRALNVGLARAKDGLLTVYDAEDDPHPLQLREAAARFGEPRAAELVAVQAPLRVRLPTTSRSHFLDRQFAIEYASLFEVTLPGLARLGLPFPLGGTSNHFRVEALRAVGGWDDHNVTEDADLGFRLWRSGGRLDVLRRPTFEPPPGELHDWLPQRTRWLKGFMQTWGVHTRSVRGLGWRGGMALTMTLGTAIVSASVHAVSLAWVVSTVMIYLADGLPPETPRFALSVLLMGAAAAWLNGAIGARRANLPYTVADMLSAPAYWSLLTLAFAHAVWRLIREPFAWDKTRHVVDAAPENPEAGREPA